MLLAIERIEETISGLALTSFASDWRSRFIVERAVPIVSEASRAIPDEMKGDQLSYWFR